MAAAVGFGEAVGVITAVGVIVAVGVTPAMGDDTLLTVGVVVGSAPPAADFWFGPAVGVPSVGAAMSAAAAEGAAVC